MLKQKHYAHERRAKDRNKKQMKERLHIQLIIEEFLSQEKLQQAQQSQNFPDLYNQVIQHLEQQKVSFSLKKTTSLPFWSFTFIQKFTPSYRGFITLNLTNGEHLSLIKSWILLNKLTGTRG